MGTDPKGSGCVLLFSPVFQRFAGPKRHGPAQPEPTSLTWRAFKHKAAFMRTTLDLPDPLFRELKARSALRGMLLKDFVAETLQADLA
jgi:hypothetical protein